ncbi:MAG: ABC transporter permease [Acidimicrobiia bacterium]|nr:ABC transporter permease [Acidimicrobiia bacterium]
MTRWLAGLSEALGTIARNPLRSSLAALAVAAAVATTAIVQTGLNGVAAAARDASARAFGTDTFVLARVAGGTLSRREFALKSQRNANITRSDVRFLDRVASERVRYAATAQRAADVIAGGRRFENATVNGTQASLGDIRNIEVAAGRFFTTDEEARGAQVIVAGVSVVEELFPGLDPLGQAVRMGGRAFRIVGVQTRQGTAGGVSLDRYIWMPITAFERAFGVPASLQVFARGPEGSASVVAAEDHAITSMRARRHLLPGAEDTFDLITPEASRSFVTALTERVGLAGPPISIMALIAAIVVVANTTLVSVTQRTHEIGIRRALGASSGTILIETLAESSVIALLGGVIGIAVSAGLLGLASRAFALSLDLQLSTILGSLAAAGLSGAMAGWYPARRAVSIDVVTALRVE